MANRVDDDDSDDVAEDRRLLDTAKVDHDAAIQTASAEVPQGRVVDLDLDEDDGTVEWDVEIIAPAQAKHELTIDAVTGDVTKHETD
ncbi:MAG TPA: PepSY domain-containing protein [Intrasporangium sp.]|nr:PepSY domain-containing protein [Intrasporangium sp.]